MYDDNWLLTLTYDPVHLPEGGTLVKEDVTGFIRKLRLHYGQGVRFFCAAEYGAKFSRPHYHLVMFNFKPTDLVPSAKRSGFQTYTSEQIEGIWQKGRVEVGTFSTRGAMYAAQYVVKKARNKTEDYQGKLPEFALMSRMPGIGVPYLEKYHGNIFPRGYCIIDGRKFPVPKFYLEWIKQNIPQTAFRVRKQNRACQDKPTRKQRAPGAKDEYLKAITKNRHERGFDK